MKAFRILMMIMVCGALLTSCKKKAPAAPADTDTTSAPSVTTGIDFDALSKEMCTCAADFVALTKKSKELQAAGKTDEIAAILQEMAAKGPEMEKCMAALEAKYPGVDGNAEYEEKAQAALKRNCPDFAAAMSTN